MSLGWQDVTALGFVLAAIVCVLRYLRRVTASKNGSGCGLCQGCPRTARRSQLVGIDLPRRPAGGGRYGDTTA